VPSEARGATRAEPPTPPPISFGPAPKSPRTVYGIWRQATGRDLAPDLHKQFDERPEVAVLERALRRHGAVLLADLAARASRGNILRLDEWVAKLTEAVRDP
jgi:hypothetical protein